MTVAYQIVITCHNLEIFIAYLLFTCIPFSLENPSTETLFLLGNPSGLFGILYFRI